jgi:hypothetical protein
LKTETEEKMTMTNQIDAAVKILKSGLVFEGGNTWGKTKARIREALAVLDKPDDIGRDDYDDITAEEAAQPSPDLYYANRCKLALAKAATRAICARWSRKQFLAAAAEAYAAEDNALGSDTLGPLFPDEEKAS